MTCKHSSGGRKSEVRIPCLVTACFLTGRCSHGVLRVGEARSSLGPESFGYSLTSPPSKGCPRVHSTPGDQRSTHKSCIRMQGLPGGEDVSVCPQRTCSLRRTVQNSCLCSLTARCGLVSPTFLPSDAHRRDG